MKAELTRFRVKDGKSARVDEWFATLNARKAECIETLEREKMYVEAIFREKVGDEEFVYWFSLQGEGGESLQSSPFEIDAVHRAFSHECLDRTIPRVDLDAEVALIAPEITSAILLHDHKPA